MSGGYAHKPVYTLDIYFVNVTRSVSVGYAHKLAYTLDIYFVNVTRNVTQGKGKQNRGGNSERRSEVLHERALADRALSEIWERTVARIQLDTGSVLGEENCAKHVMSTEEANTKLEFSVVNAHQGRSRATD